MANAGRILIMPKGAYSATATYEMLDLVSYNGTSWLAKKTCEGIEPSEANAEYWHNMFDLNVVNNLDATEEGGVLDARQGKALNDAITAIKDSLSEFEYKDYTGEYLAGAVRFTRKNGIVSVSYTGDWEAGTPTGQLGILFTIDEQFRPLNEVDTMCFPTSSGTSIQISIFAGGSVMGYNYGNELANVSTGRFSTCYVAKGIE